MKRVIIFTVAMLLIATWAYADYKPRVLGDDEMEVTITTVMSLSSNTVIPTNAVQALLTVSDGDTVRWKGFSTPTTSSGGRLARDDYLLLDSRYQIDSFSAIMDSGGTSVTTIYVIYYGPND